MMALDDALTDEEDFGKQVRQARDARGWTQDVVRQRLLHLFRIDLSKTAYSRLELGKRPVRLNEVVALVRVLGIELRSYATALVLLTPDEYEQAKVRLAKADAAVSDAELAIQEARSRLHNEESHLQAQYSALRWEQMRLRAAVATHPEWGSGQ